MIFRLQVKPVLRQHMVDLVGRKQADRRAGGKVALPKTALPEGLGFFAHIIDSEGNRVGLHALQ